MEKEKNICNNGQGCYISLQPVESEHSEFLLQIFKESRSDLEYISDLNEQLKEAITLQQFTMEYQQLRQVYKDAEFNVVMLNGEPVGRLYVYHGEAADRILEIGLLKQCRGLGIGKKIMTTVIESALKKGKTICLQVAWFNQGAYIFYEKLGFKIIKNNGVFYEMQYIG